MRFHPWSAVVLVAAAGCSSSSSSSPSSTPPASAGGTSSGGSVSSGGNGVETSTGGSTMSGAGGALAGSGGSATSGAGGSIAGTGGSAMAGAGGSTAGSGGAAAAGAGGSSGGAPSASLPLVLVEDVPLPGKPVRFDYQDIDPAEGHLVIAHMNDNAVVIVNLADASVAAVLPNIPTPRGIVVGDDVGRIFVTSTSGASKVVIIDNKTLTEIARVDTGSAPDGIGWDPKDQIVGVSDQGDGWRRRHLAD